jgi:phospholipase/carboxylesterase
VREVPGSVTRRACGLIALLAAPIGCRSDPPAPRPSPAGITSGIASGIASSAPPSTTPACAPPDVRVVPAASGAATTTLVLLHGYGASAADMESVGRALARGVPGLAVLVPDACDPWEAGAPGAGGRQWFGIRAMRDDERAARVRVASERVLRFVATELPQRGLPTSRLAFAGFSQGAMISQWIAVHSVQAMPALVRPLAVVSFSGRFDDDAPERAGEPNAGLGVPLLLVHGERDAVIPFAQADRAAAALAARGVRVERLTRPEMAHAIDDVSLAAAVSFLTREVGTGR